MGGLARLPFIPGMVVVVVAPLKPCILYKRESEIDRQTIPLWGLGVVDVRLAAHHRGVRELQDHPGHEGGAVLLPQGPRRLLECACLIGWRLDYEEMDAALGRMAKHAVLLIDESSAALSSRMGAGVAASSCGEMTTTAGSGTAKVFSMFAQDWGIAPAIRRETRQVGMPVPPGEADH